MTSESIPELAPSALSASNRLNQWLMQDANDLCHLLLDPQLRPLDEDSIFACELNNSAPSKQGLTRRSITLPIQEDHRPWITPLSVDRASNSHALQLSVKEALDELQPASLAQGLGRRIGGWLVSEADSIGIAMHLARLMVQTSASGQRMLLRVHDSAVLWVLWAVLTPSQHRSLLGPLRHWFILDPSGQLIRLDHPPAGQADTDAAADPAPLHLTAAQWLDVMNIQAFNAALAKWTAQSMAAHAVPIDPQRLYTAAQTLITALRRARNWGISDDTDLTLFAQHALQHGAQFDSHPHVKELLARCNSRQSDFEYYSAAVESLDIDDWARIRHETTA